MPEPKSFFPISPNIHIKNTVSILSISCIRRRLETIFVYLFSILVLFPYPCAFAQEGTKLLLTEDEKAWLAEHPVVEIGTDTESAPYQFTDADGDLTGIIDDLAQALERRLGVDFVLVPQTYQALEQTAKQGTYPVVGFVSYTWHQPSLPYRKTLPIAAGYLSLYCKATREGGVAPGKLRGATIAAIWGTDSQKTEALAVYNRLLRVNTVAEGIGALLEERADYYLEFTEIAKFHLQKAQQTGIRQAYTWPDPVDAGLLVRNDEPLLHAILNKALADIKPDEMPRILDKWYQWGVYARPEIKLTTDEHAWLKAHPVIRVASDPGWEPIEFVNDRGDFQGISIDYLKKLEGVLGIRFDVATGLSWQELVEKVKARQLDIFSCVAKTPGRATYLSFTEPYLTFPIVIFTRKDVAYVGGPAALQGKKVSLVEGHAVQELLRRDYPELDLIPAKTVCEGLEQLDSGKVDAYVGNLFTTSHHIAKLDFVNLKVAGETPYKYQLHMGVRSDWPLFVTILQKTLDVFSTQDRDAINARWFGIKYEHAFDYALIWRVITPVLLILLIISYRNWRLAGAEITERKKAEEALRESEALFRSQFELGNIGIAITSVEKGWLRVNQRICDMFGYSEEEIRKMTWADMTYPDDLAPDVVAFNRMLASEIEAYEIDKRFIHKDGSIIWTNLTASCFRNQDRTVRFVIASIHDITERKQAEEALRERQDTITALVETSRDWIWAIDLQSVHTYSNPAVETILGYSPDEMVGEQSLELIHDEDRRIVEQNLPKWIAEKSGWENLLLRWRHKDGSWHYLESNAVPILNGQGDLMGFRGIDRDITERRLADEELRREKDFSHLIIQSSPAFFVAINGEGKVLMMNQSMLRALGYTDDAAIGADYLTRFVPESDHEILSEVFNNLTNQNEPTLNENHVLTKNGGEILVEWHGIPILKENGEFDYFFGVGIDITERKLAEEKLRQKDYIIESASSGIATSDLDGKLTYTNPALIEMWGFDNPDELLGEPFTDYWMVPDRINEIMDALLNEGKWMDEIQARRKDDSIFDVQVSAGLVRDNKGEPVALMSSSVDISERKTAEGALSEARYLSDNLIQTANVIIVGLDAGGKVQLFNPAAEKITGYTKEDLAGKSWFEILVPQDRYPQVWEEFKRLSQGGFPKLFKNPILTKTGKERYISWSNNNIRKDSEIVGTLSFGIDITELHLAEEELLRLNRELEQRIESRTRELAQANKDLEGFSYSVSHDLRAPLRHITGYINLLSRQPVFKDEGKHRHYMDMILDSSQQMGQLIDDLLVFSRMGRTEMQKEPVNLNSLIDDIVRTQKSEIKDRTINWTVAELPQVSGDRNMLRVVMDNLISNALKYTRRETVAEIEIGCREGEDDRTVVYIRDNGVGFNMAYAHKLYGVFQRLHSDEEFEGTGIGLATVQQIIHRHGSTVWAESVEGQGATFYFSL